MWINFNGSIEVSYGLSDGEFTVNDSFTLTVNPVNDVPSIDTVDNQVIDEDGSLTLTLSGFDIDGDNLTFSASVDGNSTVSVDGTSLTVTPDSDLYGDLVLSVSATDGEYTDSTTFTVTVNAINDAPVVVSPIEDLEVNEDEYSIYCTQDNLHTLNEKIIEKFGETKSSELTWKSLNNIIKKCYLKLC